MSAMTMAGLVMLVYLYGGYVLLLRLMAMRKRRPARNVGQVNAFPSICVLITVHNEAKNIESRIWNIFECDFPRDKLEVLVASDGSTDETDAIVRNMSDSRIRLYRPSDRKGKTDTQNQAIATVASDIIVFTDADTRFDTLFLKALVQEFDDPQVGGVDGHLLFLTETTDGVSRSQGFYWRQELKIRQLESRLDMLAVASGACMAIRRELFRPMLASVGEDCLVPLDVVSQGFRMVHADNALAFDRMEHDPKKEFRTRVRMTLRNWQGTWRYPQLLNPFRHPRIAFALWSHKILRWLSPLFLLMWIFGSFTMAGADGLERIASLPGMAFLIAAMIGWLRIPLPGAAVAYSFTLANLGFLVGVSKAILGRTVTNYK